MDESWGNDDGNHNHHGTHIKTQWAERNSQGLMADTTDKNLFAINDAFNNSPFPLDLQTIDILDDKTLKDNTMAVSG